MKFQHGSFALLHCNNLLVLTALGAGWITIMLILMTAARAGFHQLVSADFIQLIGARKGFHAFFLSFAFHFGHAAFHIKYRIIHVVFIAAFSIVLVTIFAVVIIILAAFVIPLGVIHLLVTHFATPPF